MEIAPGLQHSQSVKVTTEMTPAHLRADPIRVLATPEMVRLVEQTAIQAVQPLLKPGQATVGTRIDVAHLAATPEGMTVTVTVELTAVDRRRLSFRFEVRDETEKVGEGTHERFVIDREQRLPRLQAKLDAWRGR
ncbi:MAG TPA: thioesterase family protein [Methylomirabilota bacterium]|jgi:predicted thioesterase